MRNSIKKWAEADDPNAMIKLAELYLTEGKIQEAKKFLEQAAEKNYRPAAKQLAKIFEREGNIPQAVTFYKKAVALNDVEAMESLAKLCRDDAETLDFIVTQIDKNYNEIFLMTNSFQQIMTFGSTRIAEFLPGQLQAIERRRIKNEILKFKEGL